MFYAVAQGFDPGVHSDVESFKRAINGYARRIYRVCSSQYEAEKWLHDTIPSQFPAPPVPAPPLGDVRSIAVSIAPTVGRKSSIGQFPDPEVVMSDASHVVLPIGGPLLYCERKRDQRFPACVWDFSGNCLLLQCMRCSVARQNIQHCIGCSCVFNRQGAQESVCDACTRTGVSINIFDIMDIHEA